MNVFISADIEGISGIVAKEHTTPGNAEYERTRRLMTAEVNAAIEGAIEGGAQEIIVNDSHNKMTNILIEELNTRAQLISGSPKPYGMMQGINHNVDVVFFIGYHSASGAGSAILEHTTNDRILDLRLNGHVLGETGFNAALAGYYGKPVVLVTGDRVVTQEAKKLLGEVETVVVKEGITRTAAMCLHPKVSREKVRQAAQRALTRKTRPFKIEPPITMQIVFHRSIHADMASLIPNCRRIDGRTVEWKGNDMDTLYKLFIAMSILSSVG